VSIRVRAGKSLGLIVLVFEGVVTEEEFERQLGPLIDSPEYTLTPMMLVDMIGAIRGEPSTEFIRRYARRIARNVDDEIQGPAKMAFAAVRDEFFGLGRMYEMLRAESPVEFAVFRSRDEAEQWLGLPIDYEAQLTDVA